jgi:mono/diheme cytochrome c family protein
MQLMVWCAAVLCCAVMLTACGSGGGSSTSDEPLDVDKGRQLFQTNCRVCHSLADAKAAGTFGPDLDLLQPDAERVREQIDDGGGGMPQDIIEGDEAELVARYVAQVAGQDPDAEGRGGNRGASKPGDDG